MLPVAPSIDAAAIDSAAGARGRFEGRISAEAVKAVPSGTRRPSAISFSRRPWMFFEQLGVSFCRARRSATCLDSVARLGLGEWTLMEMLDERPSVIRELMGKKAPSLATEAILEHLDNLRT
jgi:hypothetical protein